MGATWIISLGLGKWYKSEDSFHIFCRAQNVEHIVKTKGGGFKLLDGLKTKYKQLCGKHKKIVKTLPPSPLKNNKKRVNKQQSDNSSSSSSSSSTRSGKRFRPSLDYE